jgi:diadenosine tetraphosphate (Ap4A) HIT family hydrolase
MQGGFTLDARLAADTVPVAGLALCRVLLMNDARFPWLILVPARPGLDALHRLAAEDAAVLFDEIGRAAGALEAVCAPDRINVGALGNIVRQLHVHVVARRAGDAAWPGPVWGTGTPEPYAPDALEAMRTRLAARLGPEPSAPSAARRGRSPS